VIVIPGMRIHRLEVHPERRARSGHQCQVMENRLIGATRLGQDYQVKPDPQRIGDNLMTATDAS
jgi:hypothetical protein